MKVYVIQPTRRSDRQPQVYLDPNLASEAWSDLTGSDQLGVLDPAAHLECEGYRLDVVQADADYSIPRGIVDELLARGNGPEAMSQTALSRLYGIGQTTVSALLRGARRATREATEDLTPA